MIIKKRVELHKRHYYLNIVNNSIHHLAKLGIAQGKKRLQTIFPVCSLFKGNNELFSNIEFRVHPLQILPVPWILQQPI